MSFVKDTISLMKDTLGIKHFFITGIFGLILSLGYFYLMISTNSTVSVVKIVFAIILFVLYPFSNGFIQLLLMHFGILPRSFFKRLLSFFGQSYRDYSWSKTQKDMILTGRYSGYGKWIYSSRYVQNRNAQDRVERNAIINVIKLIIKLYWEFLVYMFSFIIVPLSVLVIIIKQNSYAES